jgi:molecular chaperone DnaK
MNSAPNFIGIRAGAAVYTLMIEEGVSLPHIDHKLISTTRDDQTSIDVDVFEGETTSLFENRLVSRFTILGLPKERAGVVVIHFELCCDANGRLHAKATDSVSSEPYRLKRVAKAGMSRAEVFDLLERYDDV